MAAGKGGTLAPAQGTLDKVDTAGFTGEPADRRRNRLLVPAGVAAFAGAVVLPLLRGTGARPWDTLWAEDGQVLMRDALDASLPEVLFRGHNGYAQATGRLLVAPIRYVPVEWAARYVALVATLAAALLALFVYRAAGSHIRSAPLRLALAAACVLHPVLLPENTATIVNVLWLQLFAAFWAIVTTRDRWYDVAARCLVLFLAVTTSPLAVAYLPLVAWVSWRRRRAADVAAAGAYLVGGLVQLVATLRTEDVERSSSALDDLTVMYPVRVLGSALLGDHGLAWLWEHAGTVLAPALGLVVLALLTPGFRASDRRARQVAVAAIALSVLLFCGPVYIRGTAPMQLTDGVYNGAGSRYVVVPTLLLLSAAAMLYDRLVPRHGWVTLAFVVWLGAVLVLGFRGAMPGRSEGPSWAAGLAEAEEECRASRAPAVLVPISPRGRGWGVWIDCSELVDRG